jgi:hypothetical protein
MRNCPVWIPGSTSRSAQPYCIRYIANQDLDADEVLTTLSYISLCRVPLLREETFPDIRGIFSKFFYHCIYLLPLTATEYKCLLFSRDALLYATSSTCFVRRTLTCRDNVTTQDGWHPVLLLYLSVLCARGWPFSVPRDIVTPRSGWHHVLSFLPVCFVHRRWTLFGP